MSNLIVFSVAALLVITKFLDCLSTVMKISTPAQEKNPWMRRLMYRFGFHQVVWSILGVVMVITGLAVWMVISSDRGITTYGFMIVGMCIVIIQYAVFRTNMTGRLNRITSLLLRIYQSARIFGSAHRAEF